jgi:hypothetical protein
MGYGRKRIGRQSGNRVGDRNLEFMRLTDDIQITDVMG